MHWLEGSTATHVALSSVKVGTGLEIIVLKNGPSDLITVYLLDCPFMIQAIMWDCSGKYVINTSK